MNFILSFGEGERNRKIAASIEAVIMRNHVCHLSYWMRVCVLFGQISLVPVLLSSGRGKKKESLVWFLSKRIDFWGSDGDVSLKHDWPKHGNWGAVHRRWSFLLGSSHAAVLAIIYRQVHIHFAEFMQWCLTQIYAIKDGRGSAFPQSTWWADQCDLYTF